ncbi:MAG: hypothetical protein AcusKO_47090 [Acuticoccus sp.]
MALDEQRPRSRKAKKTQTRESIKAAVSDMLIRYGYRGTSMSKISEAVGSTTTNIFYHFGSKENLIDEVIEDYVEKAIEAQRGIWTNDALFLRQKIEMVVELNRERHRRFNSEGSTGNAWSLIGRMRMETDVISDRARGDLHRFGDELAEMVREAMQRAKATGELRRITPVDEASRVIANIVNSTSVLTIEMGSFDKVASLVASCTQMLFDAYGTPRATSGALYRDAR